MGASKSKSVSKFRDKTPAAPVPGPQPGNLFPLAHGAFSALVVPEAQTLAQHVLAGNPHLVQRDEAAVLDYCIAQVRAWRLAAYLERLGEFDSKGRLRPAVEALRKWLSVASNLRGRLGLDPVSYASLNLDKARATEIAIELAREDLEEERRLREVAEARALEP